MRSDPQKLVEALVDAQAEFVVIGAVALILQGSPRTTSDLDLCYRRTPENLERMAAALKPFSPTLRGAPAELPFRLDAPTLASGLNFTLRTTAGDLDLLGEVSGIGGYDAAVADADRMELHSRPVLVMSLQGLERSKRAAGRLKDLADLEEILAIKRLR